MQSALERPLDVDVLHEASQRYLSQRHRETGGWRSQPPDAAGVWRLGGRRQDHPLLLPDDPLVVNELMATLELGYLLNLTQHDRDFAERMQYISRSGFYLDPAAAR